MDTNANVNALNFQTLTGVSIAHSFQPTVCSNHTNQTGAGLSFTGGCAQSRINLNKMNQAYLGVSLQGANIASGSTLTVPGDNEWNNNLGPQHIRGTIITPHQWYHISSPPTNLNPWPHLVGGSTFILFSMTGYTALCGNFSVRSSDEEEIGDELDIELLRYIANNKNNYGNSDTSVCLRLFDELFFIQQWNNHDSEIVQLISENETLGFLDDFRDSLKGTYSENLFLVEKNIIQRDLETANILINELPIINEFEEIQKEVYRLSVSAAEYDSVSFTTYQIAFLNSIANSSHLVYGPAVYKARALLALVGEDYSKSITYYPEIPTKSFSQKYYLAPNPADNVVKVLSKTNSEEELNIEIISATGVKLICNSNIKSGVSIDISGFSPGIYFYKITSEISGVFTGKLIIN